MSLPDLQDTIFEGGGTLPRGATDENKKLASGLTLAFPALPYSHIGCVEEVIVHLAPEISRTHSVHTDAMPSPL